ncbi:putative reverse transcriptase domain, reverse transcriptase zinc-binding domain protein [Tanacetum coccineum]
MCKISHTMQHHNDVGSSSIVANGEKNETSDATSFASCLRPKAVSNMVNFRSIVNLNKVESSDCVLPKAAANKVKSRYENSIVGFFVGKDPSFQVVQNYVVNTWTKFGFEKITRNDNSVYLFKFAYKKGEVTKVPVWVKLYNVPVLAYSEDGLSLIATQIEEEGDEYIKEVIRVEYEWKPPHCVECKSFWHGPNVCPKRTKEDIHVAAKNTSSLEEHEEGFVEVKRRNKGKDISRVWGGTRLSKQKNFQWQQKKRVGSKEGSNGASSSATIKEGGTKVPSPHRAKSDVVTSNTFEVLNVVDEDAKVSEHIDNGSSKMDENKTHEEGSLWSKFQKTGCFARSRG